MLRCAIDEIGPKTIRTPVAGEVAENWPEVEPVVARRRELEAAGGRASRAPRVGEDVAQEIPRARIPDREIENAGASRGQRFRYCNDFLPRFTVHEELVRIDAGVDCLADDCVADREDGKACTLKRYTPPGLWKFALAFSSSGPERGLAHTDATDWWYSESTTISCTVASCASRNTAYSPPRTAAKEYLRTVSPVMASSITTPTGTRSPSPRGSKGESQATAASRGDDQLSTRANARTGKLPIPLTLGGTAKKRNPVSGSSARLHKCSTMGIRAPRRMVCTGRAPSEASSMLSESIPTSAAPAATNCPAASRVRNGWPEPYRSVRQWASHPVCTSTARPPTSWPRNSAASSPRPVRVVARMTTPSRSATASSG